MMTRKLFFQSIVIVATMQMGYLLADQPDVVNADVPFEVESEVMPQADVPSRQIIHADDESADYGYDADGMDYLDFIAQQKEMTEREMRTRQAMLAGLDAIVLPDQASLKDSIMQQEYLYSDFAAMLNVSRILLEQSERIHDLLTAQGLAVATTDGVELLDSHVERFSKALASGAFMDMLRGPANEFAALFEMFGIRSEVHKVPYTADELHALIQALNDFVVVPTQDGLELVDALNQLKQFLLVVDARDVNMLTRLALMYVAPRCMALQDSIKKNLEQCTALLADDSLAVADKTVIRYWLRAIEKNDKTMQVFASLQKNARLNPRYDFSSFFRLATSVYDTSMMMLDYFSHDWSWYRKAENKRRIDAGEQPYGLFENRCYVAPLIDYSMRAALAGWCFSNSFAENNAASVRSLVLGDTLLEQLTPTQYQLILLGALPTMVPILSGRPGVFDRTDLVRLYVSRVIASYAYYQFFYSYLFERNAFLSPTHTPEWGEHTLWPRDYENFSYAIGKFLQYTVGDVFGDIMQLQVRRSISSEILQSIEDYTLYMIRPEVINIVLQAMMPAMLVQKNAWFHKQSPHSTEKWADFNARMHSNYPLHAYENLSFLQKIADFKPEYFMSSQDAQALADLAVQHRADPRLCFIELAVCRHIADSVGSYWGTQCARKHTQAIVQGAAKGMDFTVSLLNGIGLISDDVSALYQAGKDDFSASVDEILSLFKMIVKGFFNPYSSVRKVAINFLIEHYYIDPLERDPIKINQALVYMVLHELSSYRLLSYVEASTILKKYEADPYTLDSIMDQIITIISNNLVSIVTGRFVGMCASAVVRDAYLGKLTYGVSWADGGYLPSLKTLPPVGPIYSKLRSDKN